MVILLGQNKNTDFLMILAWLCRFKHKFPTKNVSSKQTKYVKPMPI